MLYTVGIICLVFVYCSANIDPKIDASQAHPPFEDGDSPRHTHLHVDTEDEYDMMDDDEYQDLDDVAPDWNSLDSEQQDAAIAKFFKKLDKDQDNLVGKDEIKQEIIVAIEAENQDMAKQDFEDTDENSDGKITMEEFFEVQGHDEQSESEMDLDKLRFKLADKDISGSLDMEEFIAFLYPYDYTHMKEYLIRQVMEEYDSDNNGELTKSEFFQISTEHEDFHEDEKAFDSSDSDKNGRLNEAELYELLSKSGERMAESELEWLVSRMSAPKKDGMWNEKEIAANIDHFVDSNFENELLKYHDEL